MAAEDGEQPKKKSLLDGSPTERKPREKKPEEAPPPAPAPASGKKSLLTHSGSSAATPDKGEKKVLGAAKETLKASEGSDETLAPPDKSMLGANKPSGGSLLGAPKAPKAESDEKKPLMQKPAEASLSVGDASALKRRESSEPPAASSSGKSSLLSKAHHKPEESDSPEDPTPPPPPEEKAPEPEKPEPPAASTVPRTGGSLLSKSHRQPVSPPKPDTEDDDDDDDDDEFLDIVVKIEDEDDDEEDEEVEEAPPPPPPPPPAPEPEPLPPPEKPEVPEEDPEPQASSRKPVKPEKISPADGSSRKDSGSPALTDTLRKMHSEGRIPSAMLPSESRRKKDPAAASNLPEAMARLAKEKDFRDQLDRDYEGELASASDKKETAYTVDDPDPGKVRTGIYFLFAYGRFANGVQLAQPAWATLFFLGMCMLGMVLPMLPFLVPATFDPVPIATPVWVLKTVGLGLAGGALIYVLLSLLFNVAVRVRFRKVGLLFGLRAVTGAMLPLAVSQVTVLVGGILLGEAFWRGNNLPWAELVRFWIIPFCWVWGGVRLAQAVCRMVKLRLIPSLALGLVVTLLFAGTAVPLHPLMATWRTDLLMPRIDKVEETMIAGESMEALNLLKMVQQSVPWSEPLPRQQLLLKEIRLRERLGEVTQARAAARRLEFLSLPGSTMHQLARGINLKLLGKRPDLAKQRLQAAVDLDPLFVPGRLWLGRMIVDEDPEEAALLGGQAYNIDPDPDSFSLLMQAYDKLDRPQKIWDLMLAEKRDPEKWSTEEIEIGIRASEALGKSVRAARLRRELEAR